jgi:hypothetical protein
MIEATVRIVGLSQLTGGLASWPTAAERELRMTISQLLMVLAGRASVYPAPPPGSGYTRTGTLGRRWTGGRPRVEGIGSGVRGIVENRTLYGPYVQGPGRQAAVHAGRWQTTEDVVEAHEAEIRQALEDLGDRLVELAAG